MPEGLLPREFDQRELRTPDRQEISDAQPNSGAIRRSRRRKRARERPKYDSTSPVCKTNYRWGGEDTNCGYTSMEQCRAAASGLPAMCFNNPYYVGLSADRPREPAKRRRPAY
ncbi:DUF3551 domain-containing protein [Bradyrhizobium sp. ISRA435]|nr:DUF3551 domain-containing protein [Bradyrhizobium sp. ISRA435]